jgi:restriction system protein
VIDSPFYGSAEILMATMETRCGEVTVTHSDRGLPTYQVEVFHDGLHKYAVVHSRNQDILRKKVVALALQWNELWSKQSAAERRLQQAHEAKDARRVHLERQKEIAAERTSEAQSLM